MSLGPFGAFGQQQQQQQQQQAGQFNNGFGQQQQQQQQGVTPNFGPFNNVFEPQFGNDAQGVQVDGLPQLPTQNQVQTQGSVQVLNNVQPPTNVQFLGQTVGNTVTNQGNLSPAGGFVNANSAAQAGMTNQIGGVQGIGIPGAANRQFTNIIRGNGGVQAVMQTPFAQQAGVQQINIPQLPGNTIGQAQNGQILAMQQQQHQQQQFQQNAIGANQFARGPILQQQNMLNQNLQNQIDVNTQALGDNSIQATQINSLQGTGTQINNQILDVQQQQPVTNFNGNIQQQTNQLVNTGTGTGGNNDMVDWSVFNQRMSEWQNFGEDQQRINELLRNNNDPLAQNMATGVGNTLTDNLGVTSQGTGSNAGGNRIGNTAGSPLSLNSVNVANFDTRTSRGLTPGSSTQFNAGVQG
ncbi:hypothetical protein KUTeg_001148 [Tegillarca granosa]|uniref:Uncharacterized protein n=1 Tax=Tegillarca granosa TaxID=220873 RepID=A0ABQ9FVN9_TEGGR|nr:hypothetical protein KUTeg_001148 [Tegillarca granosa]